ncbi:MAG: SDR family NAD(P)-dependent oxidoreductase [Gammaproteobacteria bacterium]|nr:SDR family NAD(P)-dependent oxidoreductase [Gammaproteobacteria bacterium]
MSKPETAIVVGVGPGLGLAIVKGCVEAGMNVVAAARNVERVEKLVADLGPSARAVTCDVTQEKQVAELFLRTASLFGAPALVVFNAGAFVPKGILETDTEEFERCWRVGCLGGFLVGREAVRAMLDAPGDAGKTIIFTGATASLRGSARFHNLAVGKFGLRALAQSMARELGPKGIHVAHVIIDGQIRAEKDGYREAERGPDAVLHPDAIAASYLALHRQPRSAWTQELDLRPWVEKF